MNLQAAISKYLNHLQNRQSSQPHLKTVRWRLAKFAHGREERSLKTVTRSELAEHFITLAQTRADGTMAGFTSTHRAFWSYAKKKGWTSKNIGKNLKRFSYEPRSRSAASVDDMRTVAGSLSAYADHRLRGDRGGRPRDVRDALLVSLSLDSGARLGAMASLERQAVEESLRRPVITGNGRSVYHVVSRKGKTGTSRLEFCEETAALFQRWLEMSPSSTFVFVNLHTGELLRRNSLARVFERVCDYAGVPTFRSHAVRKRNISQILTIDDPETAQRYAGHKSLETTLRHYKDIHEDQVHEAAAMLAESWRDDGQKAMGLDDEMRLLFGLGK